MARTRAARVLEARIGGEVEQVAPERQPHGE
jgi:hypothetical protein